MNFVAVHSCIILNAIDFEASLFSRRGEGVRAGEIITVCSFNSAESGGNFSGYNLEDFRCKERVSYSKLFASISTT